MSAAVEWTLQAPHGSSFTQYATTLNGYALFVREWPRCFVFWHAARAGEMKTGSAPTVAIAQQAAVNYATREIPAAPEAEPIPTTSRRRSRAATHHE